MATFLLRRFLLGLITLAVITLIVYGLARSMPGNPLTVQLGESDPSRKLNPADQQRMLFDQMVPHDVCTEQLGRDGGRLQASFL